MTKKVVLELLQKQLKKANTGRNVGIVFSMISFFVLMPFIIVIAGFWGVIIWILIFSCQLFGVSNTENQIAVLEEKILREK